MPKSINRTYPMQRDPLSNPEPGPTDMHTEVATALPAITKNVTQHVESQPNTGQAPESGKSSILLDFAKPDYQLLKEAARQRGLTLRAYLRKTALEQALRDLGHS